MTTLDFLNANKQTEGNQFIEQAQYLKDNWGWLKYSYAVAIKMRRRMAELGLTQRMLANELGCTQQHISVLLAGRANMTLETLSKLESALKINLLSSILSGYQEESVGYLSDSGDNSNLPLGTSKFVDGYSPRKKKGPKKK
ncbi:MAG: helix-turn-helix transcriptional regulator [Bacteroidales bacterium]|nr:helix-turn-helix transcriptional regulator [Bacteroidales bacterium]